MGRYEEIWGDMGEERLVARLRDGRVDVELVDDVVGLVPPARVRDRVRVRVRDRDRVRVRVRNRVGVRVGGKGHQPSAVARSASTNSGSTRLSM